MELPGSAPRGTGSAIIGTTERQANRDDGLLGRNQLISQINLLRNPGLKFGEKFLVVVNIADTKRYEEIIALFGYEFADHLLSVRFDDLKPLIPDTPVYHVGFWSVGFIFTPGRNEHYSAFLEKLGTELGKPTICRGIPVPFKPGIGVCDLKKGLGSAADLLQSTFLAGQLSGRSTAIWSECYYEAEKDHRRAFSIIADVAPSLAAINDFELFYQARMHLPSGRFTGAEALLRWRHPTLGMISPNEFIPLVETTGLMNELTHWVLSRAIAQAVLWQKSGIFLRVAANISVKNVEEHDFVDRVEALLTHHGLAPKYLELEFSETRSFGDIDTIKGKLVALRKLGVGIAIDDFGIGPNSLANVGAIPAGIINIDGSLIAGLRDNLRSQAVVKAMIALAHDLQMEVVGKSVEFDAVLQRLASWSCDYGQGYLLCRPMQAAEFMEWCQKHCGPSF